MAYNIIYPSSTNILPWEFVTQTRSYLVPLLLLPIVFFATHVHFSGIIFFQTLRFLLSLLTLAFIPLSKKLFNKDSTEEQLASIIVSWFFALYLPLIFFSNYIGADGFGLIITIFLLFYLSIEKSYEKSYRELLIVGITIGILISLRLQFAIIFLPFLINIMLKKKYLLFLGLLLGMLPLFLVDFLYYGFPGITIYNFFVYNVVQQKNVALVPFNFWWLYIVLVPLLLLYAGLGLPVIVFNYTKSLKQTTNTNIRLLAIGSILYIIFFQILTYKEIRFLIPAIIIILYDSFQSLPKFLTYLQHLRYKKLVKLYAFILLLSIPASILIAPYNYDLKDNLWLAQETVRNLDRNANVGILDPFQMTGGYLLQYGYPSNGKIYFMDGMTSQELNNTLHIVNYLILDQKNPLYTLVLHLKDFSCSINKFIKSYSGLRSFSLDSINYQLNPNKLGVYIEIWQCN